LHDYWEIGNYFGGLMGILELFCYEMDFVSLFFLISVFSGGILLIYAWIVHMLNELEEKFKCVYTVIGITM